VEFERTIPEFERAKTGHALDSAATVIGILKKAKTISNKKKMFYKSKIYIVMEVLLSGIIAENFFQKL
jgi:hypothetical protein